MDCENITLPSWQLENLLESSDRMRLLCEGRRRGLDFHNAWVDVILGIDMGAEENPTDNWWDNIPDSSEPEPPKKPAIMVEKIEDPEDDDPHVVIPADIPHSDSTPPDESAEDTCKGAGSVGAGKARKKIDRGKVMALHNAGWKNVKIAEEMGCSEWSVSMIIKEDSKS